MKDFNAAFSLQGQRAIITGGATGLGYAIAECYIAAGAEVIIVGKTEATLKAASAELGEQCHYYVYDITQTDRADAVVKEMVETFGDISILVNNAGNHCKKPIEQMTTADFQAILDVHVLGAFGLTRAVMPYMKATKKGSILFMASMTAFLGQPYVIAYSAAKSAYLGMVRSLATEVGAEGIRVNAIAPGWIETPMLFKAISGDDERKNKILGRTPSKKFGKPEDIGWAAVYLSSDAASFINGVALTVDGGALIGF